MVYRYVLLDREPGNLGNGVRGKEKPVEREGRGKIQNTNP